MRVLMYHDVVPGHPREIHDISVAQFAAQMRWLHNAGYRVISLETWAAARESGDHIPEPSVGITFDDGFEGNYARAWPVLRRYDFPATIFLVTGMLDGTSQWRRGALAKTRLLSNGQIREMAQGGIGFGSHTVSHRRLTHLDSETEIDAELVESKAALEQLLERNVASVCYPFSEVNGDVKRRAQQAGYELGFTYEPGYAGPAGRDMLELRRIGILATDTVKSFSRKVGTGFPLRFPWHAKRLKQSIRRMVGGWEGT